MNRQWSNKVEKWHEPLRQAIMSHRNVEMRTEEINKVIEMIPDVENDAQFIQPSDHSLNITNEGACPCAKTDRALFVQIRRGHYLVR
jgi:hypothetical protein